MLSFPSPVFPCGLLWSVCATRFYRIFEKLRLHDLPWTVSMMRLPRRSQLMQPHTTQRRHARGWRRLRPSRVVTATERRSSARPADPSSGIIAPLNTATDSDRSFRRVRRCVDMRRSKSYRGCKGRDQNETECSSALDLGSAITNNWLLHRPRWSNLSLCDRERKQEVVLCVYKIIRVLISSNGTNQPTTSVAEAGRIQSHKYDVINSLKKMSNRHKRRKTDPRCVTRDKHGCHRKSYLASYSKHVRPDNFQWRSRRSWCVGSGRCLGGASYNVRIDGHSAGCRSCTARCVTLVAHSGLSICRKWPTAFV